MLGLVEFETRKFIAAVEHQHGILGLDSASLRVVSGPAGHPHTTVLSHGSEIHEVDSRVGNELVKYARREGVDVVLDPMWQQVSSDLFEHIDGLKSVCPKPGSGRKKKIFSSEIMHIDKSILCLLSHFKFE